MANRYWRGGAGTWNTTTTTNWSTSSGGAGGASVPTAADAVFFDQAGTYTVTCTGALTCLDITVSAGTVTFATGTTPTFAISGSMSLVAGTVWTATGTITFNATTTGKTISASGVSFAIGVASSIIFNGVGGGWTLSTGLTTTGSITFTNGTFSTGNFAVSALRYSNSGTGTNSVSLGSSAVAVTTNNSGWNFATTTGLTFNAGTSTITLSNSGPDFLGGGLTYYNVTFSTINLGAALTGVNTFNNLTVTGGGSLTLFANLSISAAQTISGTFTVTGTSQPIRLFIYSSVFGTTRTITTAAVSLTNVDFRDIVTAGAAGTWTGTSIGNAGGNTGITFTTAKTVYWNLAGSQNWRDTGWCTASGGTPAVANYPIPQDTAVIDQSSAITTLTINNDWNIGTLDMSLRTSAMTLATGTNTPTIYGSWKNGTGVTLSGTGILTFSGRTTQQITSNSLVFTQPITVNSPGGTVECTDALGIGATSTLTFTAGTLQLKSSTTSILGSFVTTGSTLKYLQSTTSGTQATISIASGTNTVTYLSIQDSNATGGATFDASAATNVNAGNNTGWTGFSSGAFFLMFG
jgi:hypothetical protein